MLYEFGYGNTVQTINVSERNLLLYMKANEMRHERTGEDAVLYALKNPIGSEDLCTLAKEKLRILRGSGKKPAFVIIISDISRPCPSALILPSVLDELFSSGVTPDEITVVSALGSHRHQTENELRHLTGDAVFDRVHVMDSTPEDVVHLGKTSRGTDVDIMRKVAEADFRIAVGNIEFHYFAGFSGGAKALMPGVSTPHAIEQNHTLMTDERAVAGNLVNNPMREDVEEAERFCPLDFIVNVVLDEHKNIVYAVSGDVIKAHRVGCDYLKSMYACPLPHRADIVVVGQGGSPKDANLYQLQKALDNAKHAVKDGGTIILVGACNEGFGSAIFEDWLRNSTSPEELIARLRRKFVLGGHKAAAIALVLKRAEIILVSGFDDETVQEIFMKPAKTLEEAYRDALKKHGPDAHVVLMPYGGSTLPVLS